VPALEYSQILQLNVCAVHLRLQIRAAMRTDMEVLIATLREWYSYNKVSHQKKIVSSVEMNRFAKPVKTGM
jgi:hypothetical protein